MQKDKISKLCAANAEALLRSIEYCKGNRIGCFRVNSRIQLLKTWDREPLIHISSPRSGGLISKNVKEDNGGESKRYEKARD